MRGLKSFTLLRRDQRGVSEVEFALIAPILLLLLAAIVDFGSVIYEKMRIENAANAAMTYAMINGQAFDEAERQGLAANLARLIGSESQLGGGAQVLIDVNNGQADACFCPRLSGGGVQWTASASCNVACPDGGSSGKFVYFHVSQPYRPLFANYGLFEGDTLELATIGRIQ